MSKDVSAAIAAHDRAQALKALGEPVAEPVEKSAAEPAATDGSTAEPAHDQQVQDKSLGYYTKWDSRLRTRETKIKENVVAAEQQMKIAQERIARADAFEATAAQAKANPLAALEALGITYDDIVAAKLDDQLEGERPTEGVQKRLVQETVKQELEAVEKAREEKADAETIAEQQKEVGEFIKGRAADFEAVAAEDASLAIEAIIGARQQAFKETGKVISIEEAANILEDALVEHALTISKSKRYQAKVQPQPQGESAADDDGFITPQKPVVSVPASRLSNSMGPKAQLDINSLSEDQRRAETYRRIAEYDRSQARRRLA